MRKLGVDEHITLILQLIPKIEQNVLFPLPVPKIIVCVRGGGGGGGVRLGNIMSFPLFPNHWEGTR